MPRCRPDGTFKMLFHMVPAAQKLFQDLICTLSMLISLVRVAPFLARPSLGSETALPAMNSPRMLNSCIFVGRCRHTPCPILANGGGPGVVAGVGARKAKGNCQVGGSIVEEELIYEKLPADIAERHVLLMDPILSTGNSALRAIQVCAVQGMLSDRACQQN